MAWYRYLRSLLRITPTNEQLLGALLQLPPPAAKEELNRRATAAVLAEVARAKVHNITRARPPVEVRRSQIRSDSAGSGLFLRSDAHAAKPGDLIAIYAGVYTPPAPDVTHAADGTSILIPLPALREEGAYVINLQGGGWICGSESALQAKNNAAKGLCAGWAVAALANHPPRGSIPNVEAITVDWDDAISDAVRKHINPITTLPWYIDDGVSVFVPQTVRSRGIVFLASRTINPGDEILFNYRLNPQGNLPRWYAAVPDEISWSVVDDAGLAEKKERKSQKGRWWDQDHGDWGGGLLN